MIQYTVGDEKLDARSFLEFVNQVWKGDYDLGRTEQALSRTLNLTARDGGRLVGCLRILTDGYYFGTITELLVLPQHQGRGIGSGLLQLAKEHTPTLLYFGAQPGAEGFYEKNGCSRGLPAYVIERSREPSR